MERGITFESMIFLLDGFVATDDDTSIHWENYKQSKMLFKFQEND